MTMKTQHLVKQAIKVVHRYSVSILCVRRAVVCVPRESRANASHPWDKPLHISRGVVFSLGAKVFSHFDTTLTPLNPIFKPRDVKLGFGVIATLCKVITFRQYR